MKYQILSDIHLDGGSNRRNISTKDQLKGILSDDAESIIFAGDICNTDERKYIALKIMAEKYKHVIVVLGNHDYWFKEFPASEMTGEIRKIGSNLYLLDKESVTIEGTIFHGATMWFPKTSLSVQIDKDFADFRFIPNCDEVYEDYQKTITYLRNNVKPEDIVITHHTPSLKSVSDEYKDDSYTCFFSTDLDWFIKQIQPKLWIHGHTHNFFDYQIDNTRILCNPYGYESEETNYKPLILDL